MTGKEAEKLFKSEFNVLQEASRKENMFEHWDFLILLDGQKLKIDVKTSKANRRNGNKDFNLFLLELVNVRGNPGWILGKSDYIAFRLKDSWLFVSTEEIKEYVRSFKFKRNDYKVIKANELYKPYNLYKRWDRQDRFVHCLLKDLHSLSKTFEL